MVLLKLPKSARTVTGHLFSHTLERLVTFQSWLEACLLMALDAHPLVNQFEEQAPIIGWMGEDGAPHEYRLDASVDLSYGASRYGLVGKCFIEAKWTSDLRAGYPDLRPKFIRAVEFARSQGARFKVLTEQEIPIRHTNLLRFVREFAKDVPNQEFLCAAKEFLDAGSVEARILLGYMVGKGWPQSTAIRQLWTCVSRGELCVDPGKVPSMTSMVWARAEGQIAPPCLGVADGLLAAIKADWEVRPWQR